MTIHWDDDAVCRLSGGAARFPTVIMPAHLFGNETKTYRDL